MATIPIEIIIQDQASPITPTPSTNTETNITVPDTGAGTLGNNTFSSSSVASIIVPAVLLALSLATVCTLLIHRHRKQQNTKASRKEKLTISTSATIAVLAAITLIGNLVIPATRAATSVEPGTAELDTVDKITIIAAREQDSDTVTATAQNTSYATANLDFGYKVSASMAEGVANANLYLDGNTDSPYYIAPVSDGILTDNTWGYTLSEEAEEYLAVPLVDAPATIAKGNDTIVENKPVDIYYTIKADKSLPAGTYTGEIKYSISEQDPIDSLTYMQDFSTLTAEKKALVIASMPKGEQYTLKDKRDEKSYYISKLADGNVWMTQNLDHNIGDIKGGIYTDTDTDLPQGTTWSPSSSETTYATGVMTWNNSMTTPESYDPGNIYWDETLAASPSDPDSLDDRTTESSDMHYHVGNYYNITSALAMSNSSDAAGQNVNQSICPAGWRLPSHSDDNKSYQLLVSAQGLTSGYNGNIQKSPTYFPYLGYWDGSSHDVGIFGKYLYDGISSGNSAFVLSFACYGSLSPKGGIETYRGYSLRCVAR